MEPVPFWRHLLTGWAAITARFGFVQTLVILAVFYAVLIGPVAVGTALLRRDLLDKGGLGGEGSAWHDADSAKADLERAKLSS